MLVIVMQTWFVVCEVGNNAMEQSTSWERNRSSGSH